MKHKYFFFNCLILVMALALLTACGSSSKKSKKDSKDTTNKSLETQVTTTKTTNSTDATTSESATVISSENQSKLSAETTEPVTKDSTQDWIDTLYQYIITGKFDEAKSYAGTIEDIDLKCSNYFVDGWAMDFYPYEAAYLMTTSDGKHLAIVRYNAAQGAPKNEVNIFSSENANRNYGLDSTGYNDTILTYTYENGGTFVTTSTMINNYYIRYDNGYETVVDETMGINAWHA